MNMSMNSGKLDESQYSYYAEGNSVIKSDTSQRGNEHDEHTSTSTATDHKLFPSLQAELINIGAELDYEEESKRPATQHDQKQEVPTSREEPKASTLLEVDGEISKTLKLN